VCETSVKKGGREGGRRVPIALRGVEGITRSGFSKDLNPRGFTEEGPGKTRQKKKSEGMLLKKKNGKTERSAQCGVHSIEEEKT